MKYGELDFKKMDLDRHSEIAIKFYADTHFTSFDTDKDFFERDGLGGKRYIDWLKKQNPREFGAFHIWMKDRIIGQVELGLLKGDKSWGCINLCYLKNEFRGKGYSKHLNDFAIDFLKGLGVNRARLSVSPSNTRAMEFYKKHGWKDKGPRPSKDHKGNTLPHVVHCMEKTF